MDSEETSISAKLTKTISKTNLILPDSMSKYLITDRYSDVLKMNVNPLVQLNFI